MCAQYNLQNFNFFYKVLLQNYLSKITRLILLKFWLIFVHIKKIFLDNYEGWMCIVDIWQKNKNIVLMFLLIFAIIYFFDLQLYRIRNFFLFLKRLVNLPRYSNKKQKNRYFRFFHILFNNKIILSISPHREIIISNNICELVKPKFAIIYSLFKYVYFKTDTSLV